MGWKWWGRTKIEELSEELGAEIIDYIWGFIAVKRDSKVLEWGLPPVRHSGKDWYDLKEIRGLKNGKLREHHRQAVSRKL